MKSSPYSWLLLVAVAASLFTWTRLARRDHRLVLIYVAALLSAFIGAKLVYLLAEGWLGWPMPDRWLRLATGKSVFCALLLCAASPLRASGGSSANPAAAAGRAC